MRSIFIILFSMVYMVTFGQQKWSESTIAFDSINWFNYSTSYAGEDESSVPTIITALPYNGVYSYFDNTANSKKNIDSSLFLFTPELVQNSREYETYDSSEVYFLVPAVYKSNADKYEYRILLNGNTVVKPWTTITRFADSSFQLNNFKKGMAFLGGYKTGWGNFLTAQVKQKNAVAILSFSAVWWKQVKPVLLNVYMPNELNQFLARLKKSYEHSLTETEIKKWQTQYKPDEIDPGTMLPKKLILTAKEDNIVFYLQGDIYKKEALEYQLVKEDAVLTTWQANDFDNNFIWLKNLKPGDYQLQIRYRSQRHNVTACSFFIKPEWYQTLAFKIALIALVCFILLLLIRLRRQQQKTNFEKNRKEKLNLELKALRSQLNPHFVFNALSSIQGLVNKNDLDGANHYLTEFSHLLRESLKNKDAEYVPLEREIKILETYIKLEQLRFHFKYNIAVSTGLSIAEIEIPSLLIQPLLENAIKHGAGPKYETGYLRIYFTGGDSNLMIDIEDNGNGFNAAQPGKGFGLQLVKDRISLLNESLTRQCIQLSFECKDKGRTVVHLIFENWL